MLLKWRIITDFRTIFEQIPEEFDKWRPRYCDELFNDLIHYANLTPNSKVLEVGPGTGQATDPILNTGCNFTAIELGEVFSHILKEKYQSYPNFKVLNADFETYPFPDNHFDLVYSAAAFQWIPEQIGYPKAYSILKSGGTFTMFMMRADVWPGGGYTDEPLFSEIQEVYKKYFKPECEYKCKLDYDAREKYGFNHLERRKYLKTRTYNADDYVSLISTHADHITLKEPNKTYFYEGVRQVILNHGNSITLYDRITLYLAK